MSVTVVICSRNGQRLLPMVLEAVITSLNGTGQLVLVDSDSTDQTAEIMRAADHPNVTVVEVDRKGAGLARNAGWRAAVNEAVLFTDDDVIVPPNWVGDMSAPLLHGYEAVTGAVHLADEIADGLSGQQRGALADTRFVNMGDDPPRTIVGASMGLRRDLYLRGFRFDPQLGPGALGFMEETLLHHQISEAGGRTKLVVSAPVVHHPQKERLTVEMWHDYARRRGECFAYVDYHWFQRAWNRREVRSYIGAESHLLRVRASRRGATDEDLDLLTRASRGRWLIRNCFRSRHYTRREIPQQLRQAATREPRT